MPSRKIIILGTLWAIALALHAGEAEELKQVDSWQFGLNSIPNVELTQEKLEAMAKSGSVPALLRLAKYHHYTLNQREKALGYWRQAAMLESGEAAFTLSKFAPTETERKEFFRQALALRYEPALFFEAIDLHSEAGKYILPQQRQNRRSVLLRIAQNYPTAYSFLASKELPDDERIELLSAGAALGDPSSRSALNEVFFKNKDWPMLQNSFHVPYFTAWTALDKQIFQGLQKQSSPSQ